MSGFAVLLTLFLSILTVLFVLLQPPSVSALTTVPTKMNFQGRLTDTSGNIKPNGTYNMRLKLYTVASGGSSVWSEDRLVSVTQGITLTNGLFSIQLGEITSLPATLFASGPLYLEVELPTPATATTSSPVWTEGAMTPRNQMATSAYAYNAETLDGIDSADFGRISTANTFTAANSFNGATVSIGGTANTAKFNVASLFNVDSSASIVTVGATDITGTVFILDTKTDAGDPTGASAVAGAMYYNSNAGKFRCYQGAAWTDCIGVGGGGGTLQTAYDASASPATITTTAAKGVKIAAGAVPTVDIFSIDNTGFAVTANNVNGIDVNYVGGAAAVEGAGMRVDYTPGGTSGGTWNGMRIVANPTGSATGVSSNGLKLEGPTTPGIGSDTGLKVGTGWDIGVDIQSGGMQLAVTNDPATPAVGNLRIYAKDIAGRVMPKWIGPSGLDTPFQAGLGFNRVSMIMPTGGIATATFVGGFGSAFTNVATSYANPTPATTNLLTSTRRATFTSATTAGAVVSHRQSVQQVTRGNAAGIGGFFYTIRFGMSTLAAGNRAFVGLSDSIAAPTNVDPTTSATIGKIGVAINANTGNWKFVNNTAAAVPTVTDLGVDLVVSNTAIYELAMFSAPNGSSIGYRLKNLATGLSTSGSVSTNLPANTTFLAPQFWMTNNATAAAIVMDFGGWYLESDQ